MASRRTPLSRSRLPERSRPRLSVLAIVLAGFALIASPGCGPPARASSPLTVAAPRQPLSNNDPPESTTTTAGARNCLLEGPFELIPGAEKRHVHGNGVALAFGAWGGLVVWPGPDGARARLLATDGSPRGDVRSLDLPFSFGPDQVVPVDDGFVLLANETVYADTLCEMRCPDPFCWSWPPAAGAKPVVCTAPCMMPCKTPEENELRALFVPIEPRPVAPAAVMPIGLAGVLVVSASLGQTFLFLTSDSKLFTARLGASGEVGLSWSPLPSAGPYLLPVRGAGPPAFLFADRDGKTVLTSTDGVFQVGGKTMPDGGVHFVDARLQARWAEDRKLHVAWSAWTSDPPGIRYAFIDPAHELRFDGAVQPESAGIRAPFEDYVVAKLERRSTVVHRQSWTRTPVGDDFDLASLDPDIAPGSIVQAWTGADFVFAYSRAHDPGTTWLLRARCGKGG